MFFRSVIPLIACFSVLAAHAAEKNLPTSTPVGDLELVATFDGPMPTGVTVSHTGRIFVNFPRWGDDVKFTVAEMVDGRAVPYPNDEINRFDNPDKSFVSVQSVVVDPADRLWILDTGCVEFGPVQPGGAKLIGVDLKTNEVFKRIRFPDTVVLRHTYLNDVRFDLRRGAGGVAYITDSSLKGENGIIVVDLESGRSFRRLHGHPATQPDKNFLPIVEGRALLNRPPSGAPSSITIGSDGIAISQDGRFLYFCPLASRRLYRVPTEMLLDESTPEAEVARSVEFLGDRGFASDGLESDAQGRLYLSDYEHNAILRRGVDGQYETLVFDPRALWPDTLSLSRDGWLYFTANQLHRQKQFHGGKDMREKPYALFRVKVDAKPVQLR